MATRVLSKSAEKRAARRLGAGAASRALYMSYFGGPSEVFGPRLASTLLPALELPAPPSVLLNCFASRAARAEYLSSTPGGASACARVRGLLPELDAWTRLDGGAFPPLHVGAGALAADALIAYHLDAASLLPVCALEPARGARVLDMCAAPGGKALALAQLLRGGSLTANDLSPGRRRRLREVLSLYLPPLGQGGGDAPAVTLTAVDATLLGAFGSAAFDAVLLDAPCSSDRHVLRDAAALSAWSPGRIKVNARRQSALLACALDAVRPGGTVVYSTCALSVRENDGVVAKALAKAAGAVTLVPLKFSFGEPTPLGGWLVLPDAAAGAGPLYIAKLVRAPALPPGVRGDYADDRGPEPGPELV